MLGSKMQSHRQSVNLILQLAFNCRVSYVNVYIHLMSYILWPLQAPDRSALLVKGLQIGLLGCMSTVSTFVVEIYALHQSPHRWRAYAYAGIMLFCTFSVGALVFTLTTLTHHF